MIGASRAARTPPEITRHRRFDGEASACGQTYSGYPDRLPATDGG